MEEREKYKEIKILVPAGIPEIIPKETRIHILQAYKEFLLGIRELVDQGIKKIDHEIESTKEKKLKKIKVE